MDKGDRLMFAVQPGQDTYRSPVDDDARVPDTTFGSEEAEFYVRILRMEYSERGIIRRREVSSETSVFNALRSINGTLVTVFEWNGMSIRCYHSGKPIL